MNKLRAGSIQEVSFSILSRIFFLPCRYLEILRSKYREMELCLVFYMVVKLCLSRYDKCAVWSENVRRQGVGGDIWAEEEETDRRLEKMQSR